MFDRALFLFPPWCPAGSVCCENMEVTCRKRLVMPTTKVVDAKVCGILSMQQSVISHQYNMDRLQLS